MILPPPLLNNWYNNVRRLRILAIAAHGSPYWYPEQSMMTSGFPCRRNWAACRVHCPSVMLRFSGPQNLEARVFSRTGAGR